MTANESAQTFPETTLTAGHLTLRPPTEDDADDITLACQDAETRGVASEATRSLARWAIHEHGFERVELLAATGNLASQRAAEKAGFVREGIARNAGHLPDRRVDLVVYSMVRADLTTSLSESFEVA